jgi:hypothetical protein
MTAIAHRRAAIDLRAGLDALTGRTPGRLWMRATGDGWSLVDPNGHALFNALGRSGRRECLEFARSRGVLAVLS